MGSRIWYQVYWCSCLQCTSTVVFFQKTPNCTTLSRDKLIFIFRKGVISEALIRTIYWSSAGEGWGQDIRDELEVIVSHCIIHYFMEGTKLTFNLMHTHFANSILPGHHFCRFHGGLLCGRLSWIWKTVNKQQCW